MFNLWYVMSISASDPKYLMNSGILVSWMWLISIATNLLYT